MSGLFRRLTGSVRLVRPEERAAVLWSAAYFFFVLSSYLILRPLRDAMGLEGGVRDLENLFLVTLAVTLLLNPLYGALVSRMRRERFIPIVYRFFIASFLLFFVLLQVVPREQHLWIGRAFYVWVSVFNMFAVTVFWQFMADNYRPQAARRLYGFIGVGGTVGAIAGSLLVSRLAEEVSAAALVFVACVLLELAVQSVRRLTRIFEAPAWRRPAARPPDAPALAGRAWDGLLQVLRSPYLLGICLYLFCYTFTSTFLYFVQGSIVKEAFPEREARTAFFATLNMAEQGLTLCLQLFLTGRLLQWAGVGVVLTVLPVLTAVGLGALAIWPTLGVLAGFQVLRRGVRHAFSRPAREILFTPLDRSEKFKAKALIDTFVYRGGDAISAVTFKHVARAAGSVSVVALAAIPVCALWTGVGIILGRKGRELTALPESGAGTGPR